MGSPNGAAAEPESGTGRGTPSIATEPDKTPAEKDPIRTSDQYCLRWTDHGNHVLNVFSQLLHDEDLVDVTLAAEGQSVRAHKMVLSACSSFFRNLFVSHPERYPIIILKDTKFEELKTLLQFMYKGEVNVEHGQLDTLLKTAENLRVNGLAEVLPKTPKNHQEANAADLSEETSESRHMEEDQFRAEGYHRGYQRQLRREEARPLMSYRSRPVRSKTYKKRHRNHRLRHVNDVPGLRRIRNDFHQEGSDTNILPWPPDEEETEESEDESSDGSDTRRPAFERVTPWSLPRLLSRANDPAELEALQKYYIAKQYASRDRGLHGENSVHATNRKSFRTSRSSSGSDSNSESSRHSDQFSEDELPAAEVVIQEGDYTHPSGEFSSDRHYASGLADAYNSRKRRRTDQHSVDIFPSTSAAEASSHQLQRRKRYVPFRTLDNSAGSQGHPQSDHGERHVPEELTISAVRNSASAFGGKSHVSNISAPYLSIIPAQYDTRKRLAGLPVSRSATNSPRPGPSSSARSFDADEEADGDPGLLYRRPLSSVSLIESHVGVGFTLGSREKPYKCEQCGQCYKYLSAFTKHKEQNHTAKLPGDKPFRCDICGMQFKYLKSFEKHRLNHSVEKPHPVFPQQYLSGDPGGFELYNADNRSENASPPPACRPDPATEALDNAATTISIKREIETRPSSPEDSEDQDRELMDQGYSGITQQPLQQQQQQTTMVGAVRPAKFASEESLKLHDSAIPSAVPSAMESDEDCAPGPSGLQEVLRQQLRQAQRHQDETLDSLNSEDRPRVYSKDSIPNLVPLQSSSLHSAAGASASSVPLPPPPPPADYDPARPHLCPYCGKGFKAKENLKLHIRKHTGEKPFECEFCGRAFGGKSDMNRHLRIHTGERPYRCESCGKTFARADYLSKHLSTHMT